MGGRGERMLGTAARQEGVISARQATASGVSTSALSRLAARGWVRRQLPGVYTISGAPGRSVQRFRAALLWAGEGAVLSHRSAAEVWGLDGVTARADLVELTSPRRLRRPDVIVHRNQLSSREIARVGDLRVTDASRTLLDLGAVAAEAEVRNAVDDALRRGLTTERRLRLRLAQAGPRGRRGWGVVRRLLDDQRAESVLERRLLRVLRAAGLPRPVSQHPIRSAGGRLIARVDFAYPAARLAIEAEGWRYHGGAEAFKRDLARRNRITTAGWKILHATWGDLSDPEPLIASIRHALAHSRTPR